MHTRCTYTCTHVKCHTRTSTHSNSNVERRAFDLRSTTQKHKPHDTRTPTRTRRPTPAQRLRPRRLFLDQPISDPSDPHKGLQQRKGTTGKGMQTSPHAGTGSEGRRAAKSQERSSPQSNREACPPHCRASKEPDATAKLRMRWQWARQPSMQHVGQAQAFSMQLALDQQGVAA